MIPESNTPKILQVARYLRQSKEIHPESWTEVVKALLDVTSKAEQASQFASTSGRRQHLFDKNAVREFKDFNPHHSACIEAKVEATVGLGWKSRKISEVLDPISGKSRSFADVNRAGFEDYWEAADYYIEVVQGDKGDPEKITGLHHIPTSTVYIEVEDSQNRDFHYSVQSYEDAVGEQRFARFGDLDDFVARHSGATASDDANAVLGFAADVRPEQIQKRSSIIHFRRATSRSRWYGYTDYFSAVPSVELQQCLTQYEFDFYFNRGVPEFLLFILGKQLSGKDWDQVIALMQGQQGFGNGHKSGAFNFGDPDIKVQLEKLGLDTQQESSYPEHTATNGMNIVSAHGVPPLLAGIVLPGKMAGANELPNALGLFQLLKIAPVQRAFCALLAECLGGRRFGTEGRGTVLTREDFLGPQSDQMDEVSGRITKADGNGLNTITTELDLATMDTQARMKDPVMAGNRDPKEGLLGSSSDRPAAEGR